MEDGEMLCKGRCGHNMHSPTYPHHLGQPPGQPNLLGTFVIPTSQMSKTRAQKGQRREPLRHEAGLLHSHTSDLGPGLSACFRR